MNIHTLVNYNCDSDTNLQFFGNNYEISKYTGRFENRTGM